MPKKRLKTTLLIIAVLIAGLTLSLFLSHKETLIDDHQYISNVYPLLPPNSIHKISVTKLNFYYYPMPNALAKALKKFDSNKPTQKNNLYCLSWMTVCGNIPNGTLFRNIYPIKKIITAPIMEVMHYGWYNEPGIFYYHATGTGIFLNLGKSLIAKNKVDALKKFGLTNLKILAISNHYVYPNQPDQNTYSTVKAYARKNQINFRQALQQVISHIINNDHYDLNRIADSSSYDVSLYQLCRQKHYDTIQLSRSPNDNGGWGYEIMDCRTSFNQSLLARWKQEKQYLKQCNPLDTRHCRPCDVKLPIQSHLTCDNVTPVNDSAKKTAEENSHHWHEIAATTISTP